MTKHATDGPTLDIDQLREAIQEEYAAVALSPQQGFHFHTGQSLARLLGYEEAWLKEIPEGSLESFAGTGNPFSLGALQPGDRVVDVACGAGLDSLIAARMVGPQGQVIGVDMTGAMLDKARQSAAAVDLTNLEFRAGYAEALPVPEAWADVVISNGALNLMPDKVAALTEMARVLKPGGRLQLSDILVQSAVPTAAKCQIDLWTGCIAGALLEAELEAAVEAAGFSHFEITWRADVFGGCVRRRATGE
jgi:arsenite methyltransferase